MFTPVAPAPTTGQAIVVTQPPPSLATSYETIAGGAFVPTATAQGQVLVSGVGPTFGWTAEAPGLIAVTTFNARDGDVVLTKADTTTALGFTPYDSANPLNYQTDTQVASAINTLAPQPSNNPPVVDGTAIPGTNTTYSRSDHVHPTDPSRYAASNPAGYQTAAQVTAVLPSVPAGSNTVPLVDGTAAAGTSAQWTRGDHVHPTDSSRYAAANPAGYQTAAQVTAALPVASTVLPLVDGTAAPGSSVNWSRGDHIHPTDSTRYAASNPAGYQTASDVANAIAGAGGGATPSDATPIMDGPGAPGTTTPYSRGDHVHPRDTSKAPINNPVFTGTVTLAADPTAALQAATMQYVTGAISNATANVNIDAGGY
jgi:hypothetical protein